jgi:probable phosphoglycerate mutase
MVLYVRHGHTVLNKGGSEERLRGWLPIPLTPEGVQSAHAVGKELSLKPDTFTTSDLVRAQQTADIIGEHLGMPATPDLRLRDWNTGSLAGQKVADVLPAIKGLIAHPTEPAPGGEPIQDYLDRFIPAMREKVAAPGVHLVIGHARGSAIMEGIASPEGGVGGDVDQKFLHDRPNLQPGGVMTIDPQWGIKMKNPGGKNRAK